MDHNEVSQGCVVQIDPNHDDVFGGHFMVVTEVKPWGYQGYCAPLEARNGNPPALAYYRVKREDCHPIGRAEWAIPMDEED